MQATSTSIVRVRLAANMLYGVLAAYLKRFEDGTALVRFAAGNFRIVRIDLIEPATDAEEREYYRVRESSPPSHRPTSSIRCSEILMSRDETQKCEQV